MVNELETIAFHSWNWCWKGYFHLNLPIVAFNYLFMFWMGRKPLPSMFEIDVERLTWLTSHSCTSKRSKESRRLAANKFDWKYILDYLQSARLQIQRSWSQSFVFLLVSIISSSKTNTKLDGILAVFISVTNAVLDDLHLEFSLCVVNLFSFL